ncbi:hypothetical protein [Shewanella waksmanii]|uniref:hypothetical protein n=1 Tax=Shewanella waksmanii TaxID=213783 RepID=UPI0037354971
MANKLNEDNRRIEIIEEALLDAVSGGASDLDSVAMCVGHQFCEADPESNI